MIKTAELLKDEKSIYFKVTIKDDNSILRKLRIIQGVRKIGTHSFRVPFNDSTIEFLELNKFEFNDVFKRYKKYEWEKANPIKKIPKYRKKGLKPYNYQLEGVNAIERFNGRALLADVMGLGKTIQALAWLQYRRIIKNVLIICPSSLKINWKEEFEKWVTPNSTIQILEGKTPYKITGDVVIINYDLLNDWIVDLKLTPFNVCIADEIHYLKSDKSLRTKAFKEIKMGINHIIGLTGTPIENDPMEIYYMVNLINKNIIPNYIRFIQRYCDGKQIDQKVRGGKTRKIWKRNGFTNQRELYNILRKHVMIRRTFDDVDLELPDKIYSDIHLAIDNRAKYEEAEQDFIQYVKEKFDNNELEQEELEKLKDEPDLKKAMIEKLDAISRAPALAKLQELKMLAAKGKLDQLINWVEDFLSSDEKLIIFAINKFVIRKLMETFPDAIKIDGSVSAAKRNEAVKSFQNDANVKLFIGNINAAGVGLTLTAASKVAIVQFPWNPGDLFQAEGRAVRISQMAKHVNIYKFIAKGTIEERILKLLDLKQSEIDKIIDGKNTNAKQDIVKLLIESYR